jgi:hypothetical protein
MCKTQKDFFFLYICRLLGIKTIQKKKLKEVFLNISLNPNKKNIQTKPEGKLIFLKAFFLKKKTNHFLEYQLLIKFTRESSPIFY